jgi:hypothetical protein
MTESQKNLANKIVDHYKEKDGIKIRKEIFLTEFGDDHSKQDIGYVISMLDFKG